MDSPVHEWLVTDGRGGFACGCWDGRIRRRWHGLWVARRPPRDRVRLLAGFDQHFIVNGQRISPWPVWTGSVWSAADGIPDGSGIEGYEQRFQAVAPLFAGLRFPIRVVCKPGTAVQMIFNPLLPFAPKPKQLHAHLIELGTHQGLTLHIHCTRAMALRGQALRLDNVDLELEHECEAVWTETLWRAPDIAINLEGDCQFMFVASTTADPACLSDAPPRSDDGWKRIDRPVPPDDAREDPSEIDAYLGDLKDFLRPGIMLAEFARHFLVRSSSGRPTILAGYPWFTDWGRDTMIALPGLLLATGNRALAAEVLDHFLDHLDEGLIPNLFPEDDTAPLYNTIDATLWMIDRAFLIDAKLGGNFVRGDRWEKLKSVIAHHRAGTKHHIRLDDDGLLRGGTEGSQLTWMDVKIDGHVPTPRHGKPIEIQGLWFNALKLMADRAAVLGEKPLALEYGTLATRCEASVAQRFFAGRRAWAADVVDRDGPGTADWAIRPNMILPFGLAHNVLPPERRLGVLKAATTHLLTPCGLRTLSKKDPAYIGVYRGDVRQRDRAYHQGTVWPWLLAPFVKGLVAHREQLAIAPRKLRSIRRSLERLLDAPSCECQLNEIYDGDPPHTPRGCFAQAWSLAAGIEVLEILDALEQDEE
jgi:hypothetical protein